MKSKERKSSMLLWFQLARSWVSVPSFNFAIYASPNATAMQCSLCLNKNLRTHIHNQTSQFSFRLVSKNPLWPQLTFGLPNAALPKFI